MVISRGIINKKIKFYDIEIKNKNVSQGNYLYLSALTNAYKNLLTARGAKVGDSIIIGTPACINAAALVLACAELGIIISIVDFFLWKNHEDLTTLSERYKKFFPIDFFVVLTDYSKNTDKMIKLKYETYKNTCKNFIILNDEKLDFTQNNSINTTPDSKFLRCLSSKDEIVELEHGFLYSLIKRNASMYYDNVGIVTNLNHGSSCATYFLPALVSDKVTDVYNFTNWKNINNMISSGFNLNHLMLPYTALIDDFFDSDAAIPDCIIYTLGIIKNKWVKNIKNKAKDIISIFGTTETSGPFFINQASDSNFREDRYKKVDDFYHIKLDQNNNLEVSVPAANIRYHSQDKFLLKDDGYIFYPNVNLLRINDVFIDNPRYNAFNNYINSVVKGDLIIDSFKNSMYLAVWNNDISTDDLAAINSFLKKENGTFHVEKHAVLSYNQFHDGSVLNTMSVIEYFRGLGN